jgi:hypothetical protein
MFPTSSAPRPYWHPLAAGLVLGLALFLTFLMSGHGLGASGAVTRMTAAIWGWIAPAQAAANPYLGGFFAGKVLDSWITWQVVGVMLGALAGSLSSGRFRPMIEKGASLSRARRLGFALTGGILVGFGARLARGCTSGLGLSGSATLAVAGFVFLIFFFAAGFAAAAVSRRIWQ